MLKMKQTLISLSLMAAVLSGGLILASNKASAFTGFVPSGGCTDFLNTPLRHYRLPVGNISFRISQNFTDRYPDAFSQYLVEDSARLWSDFMGAYSWSEDIRNKGDYLKSYNGAGLKSALLHEFGHVMGMQHNDGCYYNTNDATGDPWNSNFHLIGGGNVAVIEPSGREIMNGTAPFYFVTQGEDAFEFLAHAYPFQSINFTKTNSQNQIVRIDSTDVGATGGQTRIIDSERIDPDDSDQGWYINEAHIWVGYDYGTRSNQSLWSIENTSGYDITQLTLRVNGTSTRKPIDEWSPVEFTHLGSGTTNSPEQLVYTWSTPQGYSWSAPGPTVGVPGGNPNRALPVLGLDLDVTDWVVQEALMWHNPNVVFELPIPTVVAEKLWLFSPNTPPQGTATPYALASLPLSENTPIPDNIEFQPPTSVPDPNDFRRGFKLVVPQIEEIVFEKIDLLVLSWEEAEILMHQHTSERYVNIGNQFVDNPRQVRKLIDSSKHHTAESVGLRKDRSLFAQDENADRIQRIPLAKRFDVNLNDNYTYAIQVILSSPDGRVNYFTLPEMNQYMGSRKARCGISGDPESCCPYEMTEPVLVERSWTAENLSQSSCIVGSRGDDVIVLNGRKPHLLATGDGNDKVVVELSQSSVQLGGGDDYLEVKYGASVQVNGNSGKDTMIGSNQNDYMDGGAGNDTIISGGGDDIIIGGGGENLIQAGSGNDTIYPGPGRSFIDAGKGDDQVIYTHVCELKLGSKLKGGDGEDRLILPVKISEAKELGLVFDGFEIIIENVTRQSKIALCE